MDGSIKRRCGARPAGLPEPGSLLPTLFKLPKQASIRTASTVARTAACRKSTERRHLPRKLHEMATARPEGKDARRREDGGTHARSQPGDVTATARAFAIVLLSALWGMVAQVAPAAASVQFRPFVVNHPSAPEETALEPYMVVGFGIIRSATTRFSDGHDSGHYALYGSEDLFDVGAFATGLQGRLAVGAKVPSRLRVQLELSLARRLGYRGNTNYLIAGEQQPSEAKLDAWQLLLAGFYDLPGWTLDPGREVRPFLGVGAGINTYRLSGYVQRFPDPVDPNGRLRRGPGGEIPYTAIPGGRGRNLSWMLAAGLAVPLVEGSIQFVLSYRYAGLGEIQTDIGEMTVVRYRNDGTWGENLIRINQTAANLSAHSLLAAVAFEL
ncbi:MAG: hypothetical protein F4123_01675 [Gemmatimonadetes bacterium]|nr:hypothetical protein [Gemmatimonadota bacterium]